MAYFSFMQSVCLAFNQVSKAANRVGLCSLSLVAVRQPNRVGGHRMALLRMLHRHARHVPGSHSVVVRRDQVSCSRSHAFSPRANIRLRTRGHTAEEVGLLFDHLDGDVGIVDELLASKTEQSMKGDKGSLEHLEKV